MVFVFVRVDIAEETPREFQDFLRSLEVRGMPRTLDDDALRKGETRGEIRSNAPELRIELSREKAYR